MPKRRIQIIGLQKREIEKKRERGPLIRFHIFLFNSLNKSLNQKVDTTKMKSPTKIRY